MNDSSCASAHNTPLPLERSPPARFKRLLGSAAGRTALPHVIELTGRAARRTVRAEYAAITGLGPQNLVTCRALIEIHASIGRHRLELAMPAERTFDGRFEDHEPHWGSRHLPNGSRLSCGRSGRGRKSSGRTSGPPGHNTPLPLERSPPASFKRMLGRCQPNRGLLTSWDLQLGDSGDQTVRTCGRGEE